MESEWSECYRVVKMLSKFILNCGELATLNAIYENV